MFIITLNRFINLVLICDISACFFLLLMTRTYSVDSRGLGWMSYFTIHRDYTDSFSLISLWQIKKKRNVGLSFVNWQLISWNGSLRTATDNESARKKSSLLVIIITDAVPVLLCCCCSRHADQSGWYGVMDGRGVVAVFRERARHSSHPIRLLPALQHCINAIVNSGQMFVI